MSGQPSVQGAELRGQCWSVLTGDSAQAPALPPLLGSGSMVRISPVPAPSDDVMKLPREDMSMFGRCPAWDNFVLVTCDKCDKIVKIEALESHVTLRHGSKSERSAYHRVLAAKAAASLNNCEVKLTPCSTATHSSNSTPTVGSREGELPSSSCTSPQHIVSMSPEPMDTSEPDTGQSNPRKFVSESEADSTTNNVISIQDTDDMANIEIISEGQSLLDSMDSKFSFNATAVQQSVDSTGYTLSSSVPNKSLNAPSSLSRSSSLVESMEVESQPSPGGPLPTHYISVSPLSKPSPNKKLVVGRMVQPHSIPHPAQPGSEKKSSRDREYDPNRHCGVPDPETKKPCTRSLTCKSHSVYLKRKVLNRSGDFDELLANHRAEKEAASAKLVSASQQSEQADSNAGTSGISILERRLKLTPGGGTPASTNSSGHTLAGGATRILGQIQVVQQQSPTNSYSKDLFCEDTLHYTTDHPKPLAVCTFGGKRLGGLFIADRSKLLTRKVMKVALNNSGLRSIPLVRQQTMPYIVNFQSGASTMTTANITSLTGGIPARIGTIKLATTPGQPTLQTLQPQQIIVQDPFKSDLQPDFKGGLKFELSRNIHTIIPSASEGAG